MIIDIHTHVFPDKVAAAAIPAMEKNAGVKAAVDGTAAALFSSMENGGVDISVIAPVVTAPKQFDSINRFADSLRSGRIIPFGGIHPDCEDYKEKLKLLAGMGFPGIKVHPDYQGTFFHDIRYKRIVSYAAELGLFTLVHAGIDPAFPVVHCTPGMAREVLRETQSDKLILAHMGGWKLWDEVEELLIGEKVYLDTALVMEYINNKRFSEMVTAHGAERILFGTDSPWMDQKQAVRWIMECPLEESVKADILGNNAARLLGM